MNPNQPQKFFGIKVSKAGIPVSHASDSQLIYKSDYSTSTWYDNAGNVAMQQGTTSNGTTISIFNGGVEQIRIGLLPDGTYGMVITKPGISVTQAFA